MGGPFPIFIQIGCTKKNTACPPGVTVAQDSDFAGVAEDANKRLTLSCWPFLFKGSTMGGPFPIFIRIGCTKENTARPPGVTVAQDSDFVGGRRR
jgi:hypothetical protein